MDVICTQQFKAGKYFVLPGGTYQAIWSESGKEVNIFMRVSKITTMPKKEFQKYFTEWKG